MDEVSWGISTSSSACATRHLIAFLRTRVLVQSSCVCCEALPTNTLGSLGDEQKTVQVCTSGNTIALVFIESLQWTDLFFGLEKSRKKNIKCDTFAVYQSKKIIEMHVFQNQYPIISVVGRTARPKMSSRVTIKRCVGLIIVSGATQCYV